MSSISLLGMAKKAGYLEIGEESCAVAARTKKARILLTASDASDNLKRKAENLSVPGKIPHISVPYTKEELGLQVGRGSPGMLAVTDIGIAASFVKKLAAEVPGAYDECVELLAGKSAKMLQRRKEARAHDRNIRSGKRRTKQ